MSGWLPEQGWTLRLSICAGLAILLGAVASVAWSDAAHLTRSPLCGAQCLDRPVIDALTAPASEFPALLPAARAAARAQIAHSPFETGAYLRLALLEQRAGGGRLTPAAATALAQSYERAPVDATAAVWRIPVTFSAWSQASPGVRRAAIREVETIYAAPQNRDRLQRLTSRISTYEGRFAYQLLISELESRA